ncbi:hypothetical protein GUJ93_ZPchr0010g7889 [Zizania palustris]|uniref:Uncharacterized protein n=1 Tax=Zizania palustris TaxID=103762 RepID=A0A8J5WD40_ZIZPA|nr:hypothetical protein GUJ93_ZPchr0010g7889 [Zizania palustris]
MTQASFMRFIPKMTPFLTNLNAARVEMGCKFGSGAGTKEATTLEATQNSARSMFSRGIVMWELLTGEELILNCVMAPS